MALSKRWTAGNIYKHAVAVFGEMDPVAYAQRLEIVNLVQFNVVSAFYGFMSSGYMTPVIIQTSTASMHNGAADGTWTALTRTLSIPSLTPGLGFTTPDLGKMVLFRSGNTSWVGFIESITSQYVVVLNGQSLPATNQAALDVVEVLGTTITSDLASLGSINMMRTGEQVKLELESTVTTVLEPVEWEELRTFRASAPQNSKRIVWCLTGVNIHLAKGSGLSNYGTLILRYPRVPVDVTADGDFVDLPDGACTRLAMVLIKRMVAERFMRTKMDFAPETQEAVADVYKSFGVTVKAEEIEQKTKALV